MPANVVGKVYSAAQRAYLAGFLDGDGAIMATIERHSEKKYGFRVRVTMKITQRDTEPVAWLRKTYGVGCVRANRTTNEWIVRDQRAVYALLTLIKPYVHVKHQQVLLAQEILTTAIACRDDLVRVAQKADALSLFNVRSKNRRTNFVTMIQEYTSCND